MSMQIALGLEDWARCFPPPGRTVVTIGNFDGFHLGHQRILRRVVIRAAALDALAAAITFDPHPEKVLRPETAPPLIATLEQRLSYLEDSGMDAALVLPFTAELSLLSPEEFVGRVLVEQLRAQAVLVGQNFRFGHKGAGNVAMLADFGKKYGFEVEIVPPVMVRGQMVSSTAVRNAIREGRVSDAVRFLGRPFVLIGEIESGTGTGRRLVVPTLNLRPQQELLPPRGVFVTETWLTDAEAVESPGRIYRSVTNVGMRPTFDGQRLTIESHLFDYSGELISGAMGVSFWRRLREEKKFASPEELRAQIACDMRAAQSFFRRLDRARQFHRSEVAARAILRRSG